MANENPVGCDVGEAADAEAGAQAHRGAHRGQGFPQVSEEDDMLQVLCLRMMPSETR